MQYPLFQENVRSIKPGDTKVCKDCNEEKHLDSFYNMYHRKDGSPCKGNVCNACKAEHKRVQRALEKDAGLKPTHCQCCGKEATSLILDHCHVELKHRGFICHNCNTAIGLLGDKPEGVEMALNYLKRHYELD